ncbi:uncharacterized protein LOC126372707 [Pectinophora gossypiella]|uniref:uncharacterized protein LOC126372707 n=1 Tax=Pectinophora gossypiella TaxID=13191 RepID=UPI00214EFAC0|nr:uncharacterized protein LOC126372707 [Pectinophora gossypiella]
MASRREECARHSPLRRWRQRLSEQPNTPGVRPAWAREPTAECHHCVGGVVDTARHTREACPAWAVPRAALSAVLGPDLSLPTMIVAMVSSETAWRAVATFSDTVMSEKEAAERERENSADSLPMRRRRPGRRRLAHLVNIDRAPP